MAHRLSTGLALAALAALAPAAHASVDTFGNVRGHDRSVLLRGFKAHHKSAYVVRGIHASELFHLRYAGVYWLRRAGGVNVDSGVVIFKRRGKRGWRLLPHVSRKIANNLEPDAWRYSISLAGNGEFKKNEVSGADDPTTTASGSTDINLTLGGGTGLTGEAVEIVRGQEQPGPDATKMLLGGSGTAQYTNAADPTRDYSCTVSLGPSSDQTEIDVLWPHNSFAVYVNFGEPLETSSAEDCGATVEDPSSSDPWIDLTQAAAPPLGKPFSVPLSIHHSKHEGDAANYTDESLSLDGTAAFTLRDVEIPRMN